MHMPMCENFKFSVTEAVIEGHRDAFRYSEKTRYLRPVFLVLWGIELAILELLEGGQSIGLHR